MSEEGVIIIKNKCVIVEKGERVLRSPRKMSYTYRDLVQGWGDG